MLLGRSSTSCGSSARSTRSRSRSCSRSCWCVPTPSTRYPQLFSPQLTSTVCLQQKVPKWKQNQQFMAFINKLREECEAKVAEMNDKFAAGLAKSEVMQEELDKVKGNAQALVG